jgi:hypothetical protein
MGVTECGGVGRGAIRWKGAVWIQKTIWRKDVEARLYAVLVRPRG